MWLSISFAPALIISESALQAQDSFGNVNALNSPKTSIFEITSTPMKYNTHADLPCSHSLCLLVGHILLA